MTGEPQSQGARHRDSDLDVLIVGAGPTGLALAAQLRRFGTRFRIIDRSLDRTRESRAIAVQARTLELLDALGLGETLVARGRTSTRLILHLGARAPVEVQLGNAGATDTRFPFILFVSQIETEQVLGDQLATSGVSIERGVELVRFEDRNVHVECVLRDRHGRDERVRTAYLAGCDGAHSGVRLGAGFAFEGGSYPQDFVLGDVEADGSLEPGAINSYAGGGGSAMFFPLGHPATWRVIAMAASKGRGNVQAGSTTALTSDVSLVELQALVDPPTGASVQLHDPVWLTRFHLHHRQTSRYRAGPVFLAGDAAHIHSPVGAQGMNTGIQDAWNLGWKLALVARGSAHPDLLDSYQAERWPVGRSLLRSTDRIFGVFTRVMGAGRLAARVREIAIPRLLPWVMGSGWLRSAAFRFVSELAIRYRRSPAVTEGEPRLRAGPHAGDRLPDAPLTLDDRPTSLQRATASPGLALLLCGDRADWDARRIADLTDQYPGLVTPRYLSRRAATGTLWDEPGDAFRTLGIRDAAQYLVRPDGHIGFRCAGRDLTAVAGYLARWYR